MRFTTNLLRDFLRREDGLVTVEWVALAAAIVVGAITIGYVVMNNIKTSANQVGNGISTAAGQTTGQSVPK